MGKVLCSERFCLLIMRFVNEAGETVPWKKKWSYFLTRIFLIINSLNVGISFKQNEIIQYCGPFLLPLNLFSSRYTICWFLMFIIFTEVLKFWMQYLKLLCMSLLLLSLCIIICATVRKSFDVLLVIELLIYIKKYSAEWKLFIHIQIHNDHYPDWIQCSFN